MKPLFTIHAGEYLVGNYIESRYGNRINAWIPSRDTGIDLLVTDHTNQHTASLQVKFGRDYLPGKRAELRHSLRCLSWFSLNRTKLDSSKADFWVFVLYAFLGDAPDFLIVPTAELRTYVIETRGSGENRVQIYFSSTQSDHCWETRQLKSDEIAQIISGSYHSPIRDFTRYLNAWDAIEQKLRV